MPQRAIGICMAIAGLLFVVGLILLRFNLHKAARTGPRWKRNLVLAGIIVLASFGLVSTVKWCAEPTCYAMVMPLMPVEESAHRLSRRLTLLEKYITSEKLDVEVVNKVLAAVEQDIAVLEKKENFEEACEEWIAETIELREKVKAHVEKIRAKLKGEE